MLMRRLNDNHIPGPETKIDSSIVTSKFRNCFLKRVAYSGRTETFMVVVCCSSSIRTSRTCPCLNWKPTRNRFGLRYLQQNFSLCDNLERTISSKFDELFFESRTSYLNTSLSWKELSWSSCLWGELSCTKRVTELLTTKLSRTRSSHPVKHIKE